MGLKCKFWASFALIALKCSQVNALMPVRSLRNFAPQRVGAVGRKPCLLQRRRAVIQEFPRDQAVEKEPVVSKELTPYERHLVEAQDLTHVLPPAISEFRRRIVRMQFAMYSASFVSLALSWCLCIRVIEKLGLISRRGKEMLSIKFMVFISSKLLIPFPFMDLKVYGKDTVKENISDRKTPVIYVANHVSELDIIMFLALQGLLGFSRPIKFLYWKKLEEYFFIRWIFKTCGMISVEMEDTGWEMDNKYNLQSIKESFRAMDKAINEGFDIAILPEGRRNPDAPVLAKALPGAYRLARKHKAAIHLLGTHGVEKLLSLGKGFHAYSNQIRFIYKSKVKANFMSWKRHISSRINKTLLL